MRNAHTRRAYGHAAGDFLTWCEGRGVCALSDVQPLHVAGYVKTLSRERSAPTAKLHLAAIRHFAVHFHASTRTPPFYERRSDETSPRRIERGRI
ncbi:MAG: site-specific integrase [Caulobacteraceae bacterium]